MPRDRRPSGRSQELGQAAQAGQVDRAESEQGPSVRVRSAGCVRGAVRAWDAGVVLSGIHRQRASTGSSRTRPGASARVAALHAGVRGPLGEHSGCILRARALSRASGVLLLQSSGLCGLRFGTESGRANPGAACALRLCMPGCTGGVACIGRPSGAPLAACSVVFRGPETRSSAS